MSAARTEVSIGPFSVPYVAQTQSMSCWYACVFMLLMNKGQDPEAIFGPKTRYTYSINQGLRSYDGATVTKEVLRYPKEIADMQPKGPEQKKEGTPDPVGKLIVDAAVNPFSAEDILKECKLNYSKMFMPQRKDENDYIFLLQSYGPIAVLINKPKIGGHVVIITGIKKGSVITHDPDPSYGESYLYNLGSFNSMIQWSAPIPFYWS